MTSIFEKFSLKGRVALVTGGAGLLGKEFCLTLAQAGAQVYVADLNLSAAESAAQTITAQGHSACGIRLDVTNPDSVQSVVDEIVSRSGSIDVLVNSAAMDPKFDPGHAQTNSNAFETYPLGSWQDALNVNLTGPFLVSQAVCRQMVRQGKGSIIHICSTYGLGGPDQRIYEKPGQSKVFKPVYYTVTKAGILGLTKYMATYYAGSEIRVNALTPGGVFAGHDDVFVKNYSARTVIGRMAHKDEMNGALLFLASDASSYMTGGNVVVDGGWTAW
ncbi:MAG TPA: SDR family oxidoreductase [Anaerolineaceae bacterium]|nr:SDR family oxidoreductase [Anaerolineaceae bacterium]HQM53991.1 SDR family oxidoreductase [Anaerolineaceae bacterium]